MTEHAQIELIAAFVIISGQIFTYLKYQADARRLAEKVETAREHMAGRIETVRQDVNGKMQQLIEAREAAGQLRGMAAGLAQGQQVERDRSGEVSAVMEQFTEIWAYVRNRAIAEMVAKGLVTMPDMTPTPAVRQWYAPLMNRLKPWYAKHRGLDDLQLFFACHKEFGNVLVEEICKPYGVFDGACIQLAIEVAKQPMPESTEARP